VIIGWKVALRGGRQPNTTRRVQYRNDLGEVLSRDRPLGHGFQLTILGTKKEQLVLILQNEPNSRARRRRSSSTAVMLAPTTQSAELALDHKPDVKDRT
jgi:hypothetical protein